MGQGKEGLFQEVTYNASRWGFLVIMLGNSAAEGGQAVEHLPG